MNPIRTILALFLGFFIFFTPATISAEVFKSKSMMTNELGTVSDVTLNGREFSSFDDRTISFYKDDIDKSNKITLSGFLDSDSKIPVEQLAVEITTDGGKTWTKAQGHSEWDWSFEPKLGKEYYFGLRVVLDNGNSNDLLEIPNRLEIGGFTLTLNVDCSIVDGKISGSGTINIPYLNKISALRTNDINVNFENLSFADGIVNLGDITYNRPFTVETPLGAIGISSIVFSPIPQNNKITGAIVFNGPLESIPSISLPNNSRFLPTSFDLHIPFNGEIIDIWEEKDVDLVISSGELNIAYTAGANSPTASLDLPSAEFRLGTLLTDSTNALNSIKFDLTNPQDTITLPIPSRASLLDTGITMPQAFDLTLDLSDYANPSITFSTSVDMSSYDNVIANTLEDATIEATVTKTGLSATISSSSQLNPVTIIDRGTDEEDVRLVFTGETPSFTININNNDLTPSFELGAISAELHFGNLLTTAENAAGGIVASITDISAPSINITDSLFLLGSKINLPNGFNADIDLSDLTSPIISFNDIDIDFSNYDNFIVKQISGAKISATISQDGFIATVTSDKPSPIDIYAAEDVKLRFLGESGPSFSINITGADSLPEFSISNIDAELDFGTLLKSTTDTTQNVIASIGVITQDNIESLNLTLPSRVKLLESDFAFEGIISTLNLSNKEITIASSADMSAYTNPVLKALSGAKVDATISTTGFAGTVTLDDELEPISIWSAKHVSMQINGTPSFGIAVESGEVSFDFAELSASIDFGDLLKTASRESVIATLSSSINEAGDYSANIANKVYLLGSSFALSDTDISFNPNSKNLTISAKADLSTYENPVVRAFDGASFSATISPSGFSGSLTKDGSFEPIVVLDRGGDGKDVSVEFTSSPTISVSILNSGIDFGISGGSAELHFGDFLDNSTAILEGISESAYSWSISEKTKLYKDSKAYIQNAVGSLDIQDISKPKISFSSRVDLSEYGGILNDVKDVALNNATISKDGFSADLSASIDTVNIWEEKEYL